MLVDEICQHVLGRAAGHTAADIRVGLGYTAVSLDDGHCGLAFTLHDKDYESCTVVAEAGSLAGRKASELVSWITQEDETACAIGLAAVNALVEPPRGAVALDILEQLPVGLEDTVGMIGYFGPLVSSIQKAAKMLHIFERQAIPELGVLPETATVDLLPQCTVVVMSATTLLNRTIDGLLDLCKAAREIAILGPSTPFVLEPFRKRGVTILSGVEVVDSARVLRVVSEAGGTRSFGSAIRKLTIRLQR